MAAAEKTGWAGWIAGPVGWFIHQQVGSTANFRDCTEGQPWLVIGLGLACALMVVAGGAMSWRGLRRAGKAESAGRADGGNGRFIAMMGLLAAGIFLVAVIAQTMAGLAFTGCER
jgi:hypothetical protein